MNFFDVKETYRQFFNKKDVEITDETEEKIIFSSIIHNQKFSIVYEKDLQLYLIQKHPELSFCCYSSNQKKRFYIELDLFFTYRVDSYFDEINHIIHIGSHKVNKLGFGEYIDSLAKSEEEILLNIQESLASFILNKQRLNHLFQPIDFCYRKLIV